MFRGAVRGDLPQILKIYAHARAVMKASGNPTQWGDDFPPQELLEEDIDSNRLFLYVVNGQIEAVFAFILGADPTYAAIERAAKRYEVKLRRVADGDLGGIVGALCAGKPAPAAAPLIAVPDRPAIIISGLRHDTGELGAFLDLVQAGGASIPGRSMVTSTSKGWMLANLLLELNTEHETVQGEKA